MSVEEALAEIEERLPRQFSNGISRRAALDALVREVKASMPCYWAEWRGDDGAGCSGPSLCPSCTARAGREVLKVEAG